MKLPSAAFALLGCLLIIGCANKEDQITPVQEAREDKYQELWVRDQEGRIQ
jgi:hypothetical protein